MIKLMIVLSTWLFVPDAYAISAAEGQAAFDSVFWGLMTVWALGLSFGLAVKLINRS